VRKSVDVTADAEGSLDQWCLTFFTFLTLYHTRLPDLYSQWCSFIENTKL